MRPPGTGRVVITGIGAVTCLGASLTETWCGVRAGRSGIAPITSFDASKHDVRFGGECRDFDATQFFTPKQVKRLARGSTLVVCAAKQALDDAHLTLASIDTTRVGAVVGACMSGTEIVEEQLSQCSTRGVWAMSPFFVPQVMTNAPAAQLSMLFGIRGPAFVTASACASASSAMGVAVRLIRAGVCDLVLTGGGEAALTSSVLAGFCALRALSTRNATPAAACRPFDKTRDGFVLSEGSSILVFESVQHARQRDARIYAEVLGVAETAEAFHMTQPRPGGDGLAACMRLCLADGAVDIGRVDYVNAHGTATPLNDREETLALKQVFGSDAKRLAISSTKSMLGHPLGASAAIELALTALAVHQQVAPPTINYETPDPDCDLDYVPGQARPMAIDVALSNSMGFGGHDSTIALGRWPTP